MTSIQPTDRITAYTETLIAARQTKDKTDAQIMAVFCEDILPYIVVTVSPRLVWEGAQKHGLTTDHLVDLCLRRNLAAIDDLQSGGS